MSHVKDVDATHARGANALAHGGYAEQHLPVALREQWEQDAVALREELQPVGLEECAYIDQLARARHKQRQWADAERHYLQDCIDGDAARTYGLEGLPLADRHARLWTKADIRTTLNEMDRQQSRWARHEMKLWAQLRLAQATRRTRQAPPAAVPPPSIGSSAAPGAPDCGDQRPLAAERSDPGTEAAGPEDAADESPTVDRALAADPTAQAPVPHAIADRRPLRRDGGAITPSDVGTARDHQIVRNEPGA